MPQRILPLLLLPALSIPTCVGQQLDANNYDDLVPHGKEVDAIYGDFALHNKSAKAIVAAPRSNRHANMTVRSIAGGLIDFATTDFESDQLSCFFPGRRRFPFSGIEHENGALIVTSPGNDERPKCVVRYVMDPLLPVIEVTSTWTNTTSKDWNLALQDDIRADAGSEDMIKTPSGTDDIFYIDDVFWQQAYVVCAKGYRIRSNSNSRESVLAYEPVDNLKTTIAPGADFSLTRHIVVAKNLCDALTIADAILSPETESHAVTIRLENGNDQPAANAQVAITQDGKLRGTLRTDEQGVAKTHLPNGVYSVNAQIAGVPILKPDVIKIQVASGNVDLLLVDAIYRPGQVSAKIIDGNGRPIPSKVEFRGTDGAQTPDWGPDSAEHYVRNVAYTEDGTFNVELNEGTYEVIVSHGPEYDAVFTKVQVEAGKTTNLTASLNHSVQTSGWVSSDFHSHSSPSGDNTGSQRGRVLNLAAEHVEFAPCTEHNRVSTYEHHIRELGLTPFLATVSGMELTGQPLPLNHQNVFPMKHTPRTQDGGGPVTDTSPESQVERIALWDDRSEKLIQQNHPDMGWLFFDKNGDGEPDEGYSRSFPFIDVMEIHPIDRILNVARYDERNGKPFNNNRMLNWLQLLNQGHRIFGVVNTDAHYNFHGSGGLRNWIYSSTDDPAKIDLKEMVFASEQGRLIMSNGPFLSALFDSNSPGQAMVCGGELLAKDGVVNVHVKVQCPNWLDVDTVFVLVNGESRNELRFTRAKNPEMFRDGVVKFDSRLKVELDSDAHLIAVTGHQTEVLGDVLGPMWGKQHPTALTNPLFVDVDGGGFKANRDTLGFPLPVKFGKEKPTTK